MTVKELYYDFHLLVNKNNELKNINIEPANFVRLYNRESNRWLSDYIERNNTSDNILNISEIIERDYKLEKVSSNSVETIYKYPEDCFSLIHGDFVSYVNTGSCSGVIYNEVAKPEDVNVLLEDKFTQPSYTWERGLAKVAGDNIIVYKKDFDITETRISFYKKIKNIDIEGYINFNNEPSTDVNPEYSDYIVNQILDRVVVEVQREWQDVQGVQLAISRERQQ